jgi:hypothetical protein
MLGAMVRVAQPQVVGARFIPTTARSERFLQKQTHAKKILKVRS